MPVKTRGRPKPSSSLQTSETVSSKDDSKLTSFEEDESLRLIYSELSPSQVTAARLESIGTIDRQLIASQCGVDPQTITTWRKDEKYKKLVALNLSIIDRLSRDSRIAAVKQIIAPAFAELSKRMSDPKEISTTSTKDLIFIITSMNKEIRLDSNFATDKDSDNDLVDLQRRRSHLQAEQQAEMQRLKDSNKIIEFPRVANG